MTDDTYVHDPESMGEGSADADQGTGDDALRGWLLIGAIVLAFVVAPALIWLRPPAIPFKVAYLVLPLIPAFLLATVAVLLTAGR